MKLPAIWTAVITLAVLGSATYLGVRGILPGEAVAAILTAVAGAVLGYQVGFRNGQASS